MNNSIKSILLVDDDLDDQEFFHEALKVVDSSIELYSAKDGVNAIEKLKNITPDIIMLDLNMPRMNGIETLRELRKIPQFSHIPVMIYSAFLSTYDRKEAMDLGVTQFIKKPIPFRETVETIKKVLSTELTVPGNAEPAVAAAMRG